MDIDQWLIAIVRNKQYWLYQGNESKTITKFFDTGFTCDGTLNNVASGIISMYDIDKMNNSTEMYKWSGIGFI